MMDVATIRGDREGKADPSRAERGADYIRSARQGCVQLLSVLTAGFRHVGATAPGTTHPLRQRPDNLPRGEPASQVPGHSGDEGNLAVRLCGAQNHHTGAQLVTQIVYQGAQLAAVQSVHSLGED